MRGAVLAILATGQHCAAPSPTPLAAQQFAMAPQASAVRFDRPLFTADGAALCPRQHQIAALRRALDATTARPSTAPPGKAPASWSGRTSG